MAQARRVVFVPSAQSRVRRNAQSSCCGLSAPPAGASRGHREALSARVLARSALLAARRDMEVVQRRAVTTLLDIFVALGLPISADIVVAPRYRIAQSAHEEIREDNKNNIEETRHLSEIQPRERRQAELEKWALGTATVPNSQPGREGLQLAAGRGGLQIRPGRPPQSSGSSAPPCSPRPTPRRRVHHNHARSAPIARHQERSLTTASPKCRLSAQT